jgi:transposase
METHAVPRKPYPTDVSDDECAFVAPYLTLSSPDAPQRVYALREVFNSLCGIVRAEAPWCLLPASVPRWPAAYKQTRPWIDPGCFERMVHDRRPWCCQ